MGGEGSGRRPSEAAIVKRMTQLQTPIASDMFLPNYSGIQKDVLKTSPELVPQGIITLWSGTIANIPSGWIICDGTNGTPDLRSRFIRGAPTGSDAGATGGSETHTHTVSGSTDSALTTHTHTITGATASALTTHLHASGTLATGAPSGTAGAVAAGTAFACGGHTHSVTSGCTASTDLSHTHNVGTLANDTTNLAHTHTMSFSSASCSTLPSYFELIFIYKT